MKYFVVVQAWAYPISATTCALESAFAQHLRTLRELIGSRFDELVLMAPEMSAEEYRARAATLTVLDAKVDGVRFVPAYPAVIARGAFLIRRLLPTWFWLLRQFSAPCVVQSGMSTQLAHPLMFMASLAARCRKRPVVFMVDIDFRHHSSRFYRTGQWSFRSYLTNRVLYDPLKWVQLWLAPRLFDLCLYKGNAMVRDFGRGRANVRNFYDTAHAAADVLSASEAFRRVQWIQDEACPFTVVYFGRLAPNKGLDRVLSAMALAGRDVEVRLKLIGEGECSDALRAQIKQEGLEARVTMSPAVTYGAGLFSQLSDCHVSVAAPLVEDTPRAAFDSLARGLPIVAFDITYFVELAAASGAVVLTPWAQVEGLAAAMRSLAADRQRLASMVLPAVEFARSNTQEIWLERRISWMQDATGNRPQ